MSDMKKQALAVGAVVVITATSSAYMTHQYHVNNQKPTEITYNDDSVVEEYYSKIKEINKKNTDLVVYESNKFDYRAVYTEGQLIPIEVTYQAKYSYSTTIDLSKATVYTVGNQIFIVVNMSDVQLHKIEVSEPNLETANKPISLMFRGKALAELNAKALEISTQSIEEIVSNDIQAKKDIIQANVYSKVNNLYNKIPNVTIKVEGEIR